MNETAARLADARRNGLAIPMVNLVEPTSTDEAYAVQDAVIRLLGHPVAGYKVGSTNKEAQRILGTSEPGSCPVPAPYLHASPAHITLVPSQMPAIEGEFAFRLGRDLPPRANAYTRDDVEAAIDAVAGAVEIVGTRIEGGLAGKGRFLVTADCGANIALVVGKWMTDWRSIALPSHRVAITIDGVPAGEGTGSRALGDPMNVMVWLANHQSKRDLGLQKGQCVSTGTCTGLDAIKPGNRVMADFGSLGTVEIAVE